LVNGPLKGYQITYTPQGGNKKTIDVGVVTTYNLTSLLKYTTYSITVSVKNTKYIGPPSAMQNIRTMEDGKIFLLIIKLLSYEWLKREVFSLY
jgi:hypothetical protein